MITGIALKDAILPLIGTLLLVIMAGRLLGYFAQKEWGSFITIIIAGAVVAGFSFFPDQGLDLLKWLWGLFVR